MHCKARNIPHLRIQDWAKADRPREKLMQRGNAALTDAELLAIIIGSGTPQTSAVTLSQIILSQYDNNLDLLAKCSVKELQKFRGIGEAKAIAIASAVELGKRREQHARKPKQKCYDSGSIHHIMQPVLSDKLVEELWVVLLNRANYLIKKVCISKGGLTSTLADPKVIFKAAIEHSATGIVLVHNHPSGDPHPSREDIDLTKKLIEGGNTLDIDVLDHVIIAGSTYYSFVDEELLFRPRLAPVIAMPA